MPEQTIDMPTTTTSSTDENSQLQLISQSLEGVMFHNYNVDLFDLLNLNGFRKLHEHQYIEENNNLKELKHTYIEEFHKLPMINVTTKYWESDLYNMDATSIPNIVHKSLMSYYDWETHALENMLQWRKNSKDKSIFAYRIKDVMQEIERLETIMDILDEHSYDYECICEMSNYLEHQ